MFQRINEDCKPHADEMTQRVKTVASKHKKLISISGTQVMEEVKECHGLSSYLHSMLWCAHTQVHTQ